MAKQDEYTRYTIRVPTHLYERVKKSAGEKSVNAEIVATLEEAYPAPVFSAVENTLCRIWGESLPTRSRLDTERTQKEIAEAYADFAAACPAFEHLIPTPTTQAPPKDAS